MRVKRGNLKLISGVLLPPFILNYILIKVKERGWNKKNRKNKERQKKRERNDQEEEEKRQALRINLLDSNSSVEVGYGFHAFIVNS